MRETIYCLLGLVGLHILSILGHAFRCFYGPDWWHAAISLLFLSFFTFFLVLHTGEARRGEWDAVPSVVINVLGVGICLLSFALDTIAAFRGGFD